MAMTQRRISIAVHGSHSCPPPTSLPTRGSTSDRSSWGWVSWAAARLAILTFLYEADGTDAPALRRAAKLILVASVKCVWNGGTLALQPGHDGPAAHGRIAGYLDPWSVNRVPQAFVDGADRAHQEFDHGVAPVERTHPVVSPHVFGEELVETRGGIAGIAGAVVDGFTISRLHGLQRQDIAQFHDRLLIHEPP